DWTGSAYKRFQKQGVAGLLPRAKMKKRKATTRRRPRTKGAKVKKKS
ncbi:MAG: metal-binding protein, partial [Nostocaceae cyanobacterium]|nr:metal-binding protein [Nostocaceae cyanobacterium]